MGDKYTKETDKRFTLRMNAELFEFVRQEAEKNKRSTGKEIEFILEQHFQNAPKEEK
jgi:hypothetical protein